MGFGGGDRGYSFYAIVGFVFGFVYLAFALFILLYPASQLQQAVRDYLSGAFLSATLFGMPVVMLVGVMGFIYAQVEHKRGKILSLVAIIAPVVFLLVLLNVWYPKGFGFWRFNFSSLRDIPSSR